MKLDMGAAWNHATAMLGANKDVVLVVAGVFFFLPYLTLALLLPQTAQPAQGQADPNAILAMLLDIYATYWWAFLLVSVAQGIGMLALLALLTDRRRPTVGEALAHGAKGFLPYLGSQLLAGLCYAVGLGIPLAAAAASGIGALTLVLGLLAVVAGVYLFVKFSLIAQVIAIDGIMNPLKVLQRSWQLTKGNSLRLLAFYLLLLIAVGIVVVIITMIFGLVFALLGGQFETIGNGIVGSILNTIFVVIFLATLAAVHRQLAGPSAEAVSETFE